MRKRLNWLYYIGGCLVPPFGLFVLLGVDQSMCYYARERELCFREYALSETWWKLVLAAALGFLIAFSVRRFSGYWRRHRTL